jgi:hypothetical protein
MTVKEVLKTTAMLLGREDVSEYLDGTNENIGEDTLSSVNVLVGLINLVISELSNSYIPLVKAETVSVSGGKIYFSDLSETALKIQKVFVGADKEINFSYHPEYIAVDGQTEVRVQYEYMPSNRGLDDEVGYSERQVARRVLAYGTAAEFCITEGSFDKAVMWHERYVEELKSICLPINSKIKTRSWV